MGAAEKKQRMVMTYEVIVDDITALAAARILETWLRENHDAKIVFDEEPLPFEKAIINLERNGEIIDPKKLETAERSLGVRS